MNRKPVLMLTLTLLVGTLSVASYVQKARASGTIYIRADGSIDPPTPLIATVDNVTYTLIGYITSDTDGIVVERDNIVVDGAGYAVTGSGSVSSTGITLRDRSNATIRNMTIENFHYGIHLGSSTNSTLSGNIVAHNYQGIWLSSSSNSVLSGNNVTANNGDGIELASSSNNILSGNNITSNQGHGILLFSSSNSTLSSNSVTNNGRGIELDVYSGHNVLSSNNVANTVIGIWASSSSNNNVLSGNNVTSNSQYGVHFTDSSNNSVFHNSLMYNTIQVYTQSSNNIWDDGFPSGGNYWSDYIGTDANHDGIGDTPYVIDANNTDHYPLIVPYVIPEFPTFLILSLFMTTTLLAVIICRKRRISIR